MNKYKMLLGVGLLSVSSLAIPNAAMAEDWCPNNSVVSVLIDVPFAVFNTVGYVFDDNGRFNGRRIQERSATRGERGGQML